MKEVTVQSINENSESQLTGEKRGVGRPKGSKKQNKEGTDIVIEKIKEDEKKSEQVDLERIKMIVTKIYAENPDLSPEVSIKSNNIAVWIAELNRIQGIKIRKDTLGTLRLVTTYLIEIILKIAKYYYPHKITDDFVKNYISAFSENISIFNEEFDEFMKLFPVVTQQPWIFKFIMKLIIIYSISEEKQKINYEKNSENIQNLKRNFTDL